jgi:hypothetical protein
MRHVGKRHGTRRGGVLGRTTRYGGSKRNCRRTRRGGDSVSDKLSALRVATHAAAW